MASNATTVAVLPPDVANKIAAGEVVERPVSVIKELVENALDAGAGRIGIEIEGGGRKLIRISDDGCGMSRSDAVLAVQRHATSKIRTAQDIDAITTMGFRGEALPSIASVSQFELLTCDRASGAATSVKIDGGAPAKVASAARAPGTTVSARNLFYCVPARAKFLKTTATELSHVGRFVHSVSLAFPHVAFKYSIDGAVHVDVPPQPVDTPFADALRTRLVQLRGQDLADSLIPLEHAAGDYTVSGFVASASRAVLTRQELYFYVNRRLVRCSWFATVVKRAFGTLLGSDKYPYAFVFVSMPPQAVDVNIHPAKLEVRFGSEFAVQSAVSVAVMNALRAGERAPVAGIGPAADAGPGGRAGARMKPPVPSRTPWTRKLTVDEWKRLYGVTPDAGSAGPQPAPGAAPSPQPAPPGSGAGPGSTPAVQPSQQQRDEADRIRAVGQVGGKYIVAEISGARNGIVLIDQHAAHERVNYDAVIAAMTTSSAPQQALLMPETVHLPNEQAVMIRACLDELRAAGFGIEEFGTDTFKIDAVPGYIELGALEPMLAAIAADLRETGGSRRADELRQRLALVLVCRGSVKFNQSLSLPEMQALIGQLQATRTPWTCPHGRPTMIVVPFDELEKRFGRRG